MSDVFSLIDESVEADKFDKIDETKGSRLSSLVKQSLDMDQQIADTEKFLKDLKFKKRKINEEDIPALMQEMDIESVTVDGNKVSLRQFVHARIPEERRESAYAWLREIGEGDIIKHDVTVSFNAGQDNVAYTVVDQLKEDFGLDPAQKTHVHPQTLRAWVKNRIESGEAIDFDMFGVFCGTEAKIKRK